MPYLYTFVGMKHLLFACTLLVNSAALAQTAPPAYDFLTVAELEASISPAAKILFSPAFAGKTELPLEALPGTGLLGAGKAATIYQRNLEAVNQQLAAVTAAGWELVQVSPTNNFVGEGHIYLFRRIKK